MEVPDPPRVVADPPRIVQTTAKVQKPAANLEGQWDWQGHSSQSTSTNAMRQHLMSAHGFTLEQVVAMSLAQLIAAHDASHNATKAVRVAAPPVFVPFDQSCPGGNCPRPTGVGPIWPRFFGRR